MCLWFNSFLSLFHTKFEKRKAQKRTDFDYLMILTIFVKLHL